MRGPIFVAALGATLLVAHIGWAIAVGRFWQEGSVLFALPWGRVTLVDLYLGFSLFSGWVLFREASLVRALACLALVMTLGNAFAAVYVVVALVRSRGSWSRFWLGHRFSEGKGAIS